MLANHSVYQCSGCTCCENVCPTKAIRMIPDHLGFKYPVIDEALCFNCNLCENICPFTSSLRLESDGFVQQFYAARHKCLPVVMKSQSGAMFVALSDYVLEHNGVVYGVGWRNHFEVAHMRAVDKDERDNFLGSKYVQSDLTGIFELVKNDLLNNKLVLFVGTPCQVAGLKACLKSQMFTNLILCDIICHGVASPNVWKDYIDYIEKSKNDTIVSANFRDKQMFGWRTTKSSFVFSKAPLKKIFFLSRFYRTVLFRPSCGNCKFCNLHRYGDITIGDFWSKEKLPEFAKDENGVSVVIINSKTGSELFNNIKNNIEYESVPKSDALQWNLIHPTPEDIHRLDFEKLYAKSGFLPAMRKYHDFGIVKQLRMFLHKLKTNGIF